MKVELQTPAERPALGEQGSCVENWALLLGMGVALMLLGSLVIGEPFAATFAAVQVMGMLLVLGGIFQAAGSFWGRRWRGFILQLLAGVFYLIVGVFMIENTAEAAAALTLLVAASLLVGGVFRIALSVSQRFDGWGLVFLNGVVSVMLGAAIWRHWPISGFWVIGLFIGIEMLFGGLSWVMLALRVRVEPKAPLPA